MSLPWMILIVYVCLALVIGGLYEINKPSVDGRQKQKDTVASFGYFYLYLYISTPLILVASIFGRSMSGCLRQIRQKFKKLLSYIRNGLPSNFNVNSNVLNRYS